MTENTASPEPADLPDLDENGHVPGVGEGETLPAPEPTDDNTPDGTQLPDDDAAPIVEDGDPHEGETA